MNSINIHHGFSVAPIRAHFAQLLSRIPVVTQYKNFKLSDISILCLFRFYPYLYQGLCYQQEGPLVFVHGRASYQMGMHL